MQCFRDPGGMGWLPRTKASVALSDPEPPRQSHVLWMSDLETWSRTGALETRRSQVPEGLTLNFTLLNLGFAFL